MTTTSIKPVDLAVGAAIRRRRTELGMSQTKLAHAIGLTFQQVQKYERGDNRVSMSTMVEIATVLDAPLDYFARVDSSMPRDSGVRVMQDSPAMIRLAERLHHLPAEQRSQVLKAVGALAKALQPIDCKGASGQK